MNRIPCALCDSPANEFCMVEIPVEGIGKLAVYFCEEDFRRLTPRFVECGYIRQGKSPNSPRTESESS